MHTIWACLGHDCMHTVCREVDCPVLFTVGQITLMQQSVGLAVALYAWSMHFITLLWRRLFTLLVSTPSDHQGLPMRALLPFVSCHISLKTADSMSRRALLQEGQYQAHQVPSLDDMP